MFTFFVHYKTIIFILLTSILLIIFSLSFPPPVTNLASEYLTPPKNIEHFAFGYRYPLSDTLWIRAVQDLDYCENPIAKNLCQGKGWVYHMLDIITDLDPQFRTAYSIGGLALTIVISDIEGASLFFDKAIRNFPKDPTLLMRAAYHAYYEEKDSFKSARLLETAGKNGAPEWVLSLASRLYFDSGQKDFAYKLYSELKTQNISESILKRIKEKLNIQD